MITSNIIHRVFPIIWNNNIATAFTIDVEYYQYIITAKHLFFDENNNDLTKIDLKKINNINIIKDNNYINIAIKSIIIDNELVDMAVFSIDDRISPNFVAEPKSNGLIYGQDLYFIGYPYQLDWGNGHMNFGRPFPLARKGIASSLPSLSVPNGIFYIDAINNAGFSGSPVIFKQPNSNDFNIAGVISAYRTNKNNVLKNNSITDYYVSENTGLTIAYSIDQAIAAIKK